MKRSELTGRHNAVDSVRGKSVKTKLMALAIGFAGLLPAASAHAQGSLEGAWQVHEITVSRGAFARTDINPIRHPYREGSDGVGTGSKFVG